MRTWTLDRPRMRLALIAVVFCALFAGSGSARASNHTWYPETGHYLGGAFRDFWHNNGGLYVFGFPITEEYAAPNGRITQYFERARFEFFPEHSGSAHMVQLGHLGRELTGDRIFPQIPPRPNDANHRYFPETQHMIMWGFKQIWETRGGLALFGYPISEEIDEVLPADNKWHVVQYFERARFEYWGDRPPGERVLISDLGRRLAPAHLQAPLPPGTPPGTLPGGTPPPPPPPGGPNLPPSQHATVTPASGQQGTEFSFNAFGFQPGEQVAVWSSAPDGSVYPADFEVFADPDGSLTSTDLVFISSTALPTGIWNIVAQGTRSNHVAIGYFEITPAPPSALPPDKNARVEPREGPQGTTFYFFAGGFAAREIVYFAAFNEFGDQVSDTFYVESDNNGSIDWAGIYFTTSVERTPPGIYRVVAVGEQSGRDAYAYLRVTPASSVSGLLRAGPAAAASLGIGQTVMSQP